ncbi:DUF4845 domain-containing protein [Leucothrix pacifica]|uniref:DUF4845 domain-containing protein n=1 Tax=Leucothrix pacifica TaxID=1247513 RepID=A0A317CGR7_9GAMM|nr:DUF4845 domain-containing protein [Leucothrix pacifica]PWQ97726.1 hypothetical protein DKW60_10155 [Leucothrix pacifica]
MKNSQHKQMGATLISWMIGIAVGILIISAGLKIGPNYLEYHSVKSFMDGIASEPGIEKRNKREILTRVERYLNVNSLESLSRAYYDGKSGKPGTKQPFEIVKLKKSNKRELAVQYQVKKSWLGNVSFLMDYQYSVELGKQN